MKTIVFVECNISGTGVSALKIAKRLGYHTVLFTKECAFYRKIPDDPTLYVDDIIELNTDCMVSVLHKAMQYNTVGVVAFGDYRLVTAAAVSHALGLPSPSIKALVSCRYKNISREILSNKEENIKFKVCQIGENIDFSEFTFPLVVKPCDDSGSSQVTICSNIEEANIAVTELINFRINNRGYKLSSYYLIEEFIQGSEYSAEVYWNIELNQWEVLGITEKITTQGKYAVEIGHNFPCKLELKNKIEETIIGWLNRLGLSHTVAHVEFKLDNNKIRLIEVNPRVAGGMIDNLCENVTGFSLVECYLSLHVKGMSYIPQSVVENRFASIRFITPTKLGTIKTISTALVLSPSLLYKFVSTPIDAKALKDSYSRLGYIVVYGTCAEEVITSVESKLQQIKIEYIE
ncbi:ATP-grasp domain-containing protein [Providencia sp. SP181]|uniref:ATP-grasp domain-containing protein n=1 Tax=Providencia sp. SP181 TaxID=3136277 RepID=UPI003D290BE0